MPAQLLGEEAKGRAGHVDARRVDKQVKPLAETVLLVENPSTRASPRCHLNYRTEQAG